jgi:hypothetical protein
MGYTGAAMTDEELLHLVRRTEFRRKFGTVLLLVGAVVAAAGLTQFIPVGEDHLPNRWIVCGAIAIVCFAAGAALRFAGRLPPEARAGRVAMLRAERMRTGRQAAFLLMPLSLGFMLTNVMGSTARLVAGLPIRHLDMFVVASFIVFLIVFALLLAGRGLDRWARPVLDDELSREFRGKAFQFGYAILLPGVACLFVIGLFKPNEAVILAPLLAALGVGGPALRLWSLERSAGPAET